METTPHAHMRHDRGLMSEVRLNGGAADDVDVYVVNSAENAEALAAKWMRDLGFVDADVTPPGSDGGIDVVSSGAVAQVKFSSGQIARPVLQSLVGAAAYAHPNAWLFFFAWKGYSSQALEFAEQADIALFQYELDGRVEPVSTAAHEICRAARDIDETTTEAQEEAPRTGERLSVRRIAELLLSVLLLVAIVYFATHRDALVYLIALVIAGGLFVLGVRLTFARSRRRGSSRSGRRR
ncbi:restriction endonuclease [Blastococcus sp. SYSU DS0541]